MSLRRCILISSFIGSFFILIAMNSVDVGICEKSAYSCRTILDTIEHIFYFFLFILFFSLVTFKMKEVVFSAWWKFAQIAIPTIFLISFIISLGLHHSPGGFFNIDNEIDVTAYFLMYSIFVIGSLIQIYRGYRRK